MTPIILISMLIFFILTVPIALSIGIASMLGLWWSGDVPLIVLV